MHSDMSYKLGVRKHFQVKGPQTAQDSGRDQGPKDNTTKYERNIND